MSENLQWSWWIYFVSTALLLILFPFRLNFDVPGLFSIVILLGGGSLIGFLLILSGMRSAGRDLNGTDLDRRLDIRV